MKLTGAWKRPETLAGVALFVTVVAVPLTGSYFWVQNLSIVAIFAIAVIGLNILLGHVGQVSFAQTTFMAVGGYSSGIFAVTLGVNPWLALLTGVVLSLVLSTLIGFPLLRLRGHYLGMATFAVALGTQAFASAAVGLTQGAIGISAIPPLRIGAMDFSNPTDAYVIIWVFCAFALIVAYLFTSSRVGRDWRAVATREDIAQTLGINPTRSKLLAFVVAGALAAIAGSLYVELTGTVGPDLYGISTILNIFIMLFIGGRGSLIGPVVGSGVVVLLPDLFSGLQQYESIIFMGVLLVMIVVWPGGVFGKLRDTMPLSSVLPTAVLRRMPSAIRGEA